jgi:hypothetical protein
MKASDSLLSADGVSRMRVVDLDYAALPGGALVLRLIDCFCRDAVIFPSMRGAK